jgi:signal transduction histidine kinase
MLIAAFFATILFFLVSSIVAIYISQGITYGAETISGVVLPGIQHLSGAMTSLRRMDPLLDELTDVPTADHQALSAELQKSRDSLNREWQEYRTLPELPGRHAKRELEERAMDGLREVSRSIDATLRHVQAGDEKRAREVRITQTVPAIDRCYSTLHGLVDLTVEEAGVRSEAIASLRKEASLAGLWLHVVSAVFATLAGLLLVRLVRRFAGLAELRVTELEQFAGRVAHDIRSPLSAVGLALQVSKTEQELDDKVRSRLERASGTVQRIGQLVDGLLVFAVAGAPPTHHVQANVKEELGGVIEGFLPRAQEQEIALCAEEIDQGSVACSPGVLTSIVSNLVGNALKYMGDTSVRRVIVRARDVGGMMRIEVQDTGPGVPVGLRERIFDPYVRAATSGVSGLGLGLATVRRLVDAHGGAVGVEANPDGGSLFWLQLPKVFG